VLPKPSDALRDVRPIAVNVDVAQILLRDDRAVSVGLIVIIFLIVRTAGSPAAPSLWIQNNSDLWRAGHAHAGVWLILALVALRYVERRTSQCHEMFVRGLIPIAAIPGAGSLLLIRDWSQECAQSASRREARCAECPRNTAPHCEPHARSGT
jgi:hypothetical protein